VYVKRAEWNHSSFGDNSSVGNHTFTVFAIPVSRIESVEPIDESITEAVEDIYKSAGFTVKNASEASCDEAAIISPTIDKVHYWSYSWLYPLFIKGGGIRLRVRADTKNGKSLWSYNYDASSLRCSLVACFGFDSEIKSDMTKITPQMVADASRNSAVVPDAAMLVSKTDNSAKKAASGSVLDDLKKLKELKDSGVLSEDEYQKKHKELLDRM